MQDMSKRSTWISHRLGIFDAKNVNPKNNNVIINKFKAPVKRRPCSGPGHKTTCEKTKKRKSSARRRGTYTMTKKNPNPTFAPFVQLKNSVFLIIVSHVYGHCAGPMKPPGDTCLEMAVPAKSIVCRAPSLPHHLGLFMLVRYSVKKMSSVEMMRPQSSAADVM